MAWQLLARMDCDQDWTQWADGVFYAGQGPMLDGIGQLVKDYDGWTARTPEQSAIPKIRMIYTLRPNGSWSPGWPPLKSHVMWADIPPCSSSLRSFADGDRVEVEVDAAVGVRSRKVGEALWREYLFDPGAYYMPFYMFSAIVEPSKAVGIAEVYVDGLNSWHKFWTGFVNSVEQER